MSAEANPENAKGAKGMTRRDMVRRLATAMSAGAALGAAPGLAAAHPVYKHVANDATMEQASAQAAEPNWTPAFFDAHQDATFTVLAERIVPGATDARVNRFVDLLLSVDTLPVQKNFVNSLSAFERYSLVTYNMPFKDLSEDQQNKVLTAACAMQPGRPLAGAGRRRHILGPQNESHAEEAEPTLRDHFENLKHWATGAYFSSEPGMKYLGWTGQVMWDSFPGCKHPEGHA
ncbi:MAG: gluconate 2-dehydrogenase subunit 3 family protein [Terriglobia bacterium]